MLEKVGAALARTLSRERPQVSIGTPASEESLHRALRPGDVLLVEGSSRVSTVIKFLTQSTWSHAALFVGERPADARLQAGHSLIEADTVEGVRSTALEGYAGRYTRICRPIGLLPADAEQLVQYAVSRLGNQYDLRNIFDLLRYFLPEPPVPRRFRRRMLALGSGDPTRAICSTLIAQAFQSIRYPILPVIESAGADSPDCPGCMREILHVKHHSLFTPRDFDVSPYFQVLKPELPEDFDYHGLSWAEEPTAFQESEGIQRASARPMACGETSCT